MTIPLQYFLTNSVFISASSSIKADEVIHTEIIFIFISQSKDSEKICL